MLQVEVSMCCRICSPGPSVGLIMSILLDLLYMWKVVSWHHLIAIRPHDQWLSVTSVYFFLAAFFSTQARHLTLFPLAPKSGCIREADRHLHSHAFTHEELRILCDHDASLFHWNLPGALILEAFQFIITSADIKLGRAHLPYLHHKPSPW